MEPAQEPGFVDQEPGAEGNIPEEISSANQMLEPEVASDPKRPRAGRPRVPQAHALDQYAWDGNDFFSQESYPTFPRPPAFMTVARMEGQIEVLDVSYYPVRYSRRELMERGGQGRYVLRLHYITSDGKPSSKYLARQQCSILQGGRRAWPPQDVLRSQELVAIGVEPPESPVVPTPVAQEARSQPTSQCAQPGPQVSQGALRISVGGQDITVHNADGALTAIFGLMTSLGPQTISAVQEIGRTFMQTFAEERKRDRERMEKLEDNHLKLFDRIVQNDRAERGEWLTRLRDVEDKMMTFQARTYDQGIEYNKSFATAVADLMKQPPAASLPDGQVQRDLLRLEGLIQSIETKIESRIGQPGQPLPVLDNLKQAFETVDAVNQRIKAQFAQFDASPASTVPGADQSLLRQFLTPANLRFLVDNLDKFASAARMLMDGNAASGVRPTGTGPARPMVQAPIGTGR